MQRPRFCIATPWDGPDSRARAPSAFLEHMFEWLVHGRDHENLAIGVVVDGLHAVGHIGRHAAEKHHRAGTALR